MKIAFHTLAHIIFAVLLSVSASSAVAADGYSGGYTITLTTGKVIHTPTISAHDGKVFFEQFGSQISISREMVLAVQRDDSPAPSARPGHLDIPVYLQVSGVKNRDFNGLYEENGMHDDKPAFKQVNGPHILFYSTGHHRVQAWCLGRQGARSPQISFVNPSIGTVRYPENQGGWTSVTGEIMYPHIKVTKTSPPETVFRGNQAYVLRNFPLPECNGVYRPKKISSGHISYTHEKNPYTLHFSAHSWMISSCQKNCFRQFWSKSVSVETMPENVEHWYNISNAEVAGEITTFRHSSRQ